MKNLNEKLNLFQQLINCNHDLYFWCYSPNLELQSSNCPSDLIDDCDTLLKKCSAPLLDYAQDGHYPFILDNFLNIIWLVDFKWENGSLNKMYIIGPMFSGRNSYQQLKKNLDKKNCSVSDKILLLKRWESIPIIPTNLLFEYAIMLHYCITGEKISFQNFKYSSEDNNLFNDDEIHNIHKEHRGIWIAEQSLLSMIREGSSNYKQALEKSSSLSSGVNFDVGDSLRQAKNNLLVLLTLCSRAAIEGGLSPSISYTLCDYYTQRSEDSGTISEVSLVCHTMLEDFITRVHQSKNNPSISKPVQNCCDYISIHVKEKLSIDFLAKNAGYTEYYFSRKFKKEMNISLGDYINIEKIKYAKILLSSTTMKIQDIGNELSFSSRTYFSDTFQKISGCSPSEYRENNLKI